MEATQNRAAWNVFASPRSSTLFEILERLRWPVPDRLISTKRVPGKYDAAYIRHTVVRDLLDLYAPGWESRTSITSLDGRVYVTVSLTLHGSDGSITRDGIGNELDEIEEPETSAGTAKRGPSYGDPSSNAQAQALRRAAMEFGLGRALWKK